MSVADKSTVAIVPNVGGAVRAGWSLWMANANGDGVAIPWPGGSGTLVIALNGTGATLGSGTVNVKTKFIGKDSAGGSSFVTVDNTDQLNVTGAGTYDFRLGACDIVVSLVGATNPLGVCAGVIGYNV